MTKATAELAQRAAKTWLCVFCVVCGCSSAVRVASAQTRVAILQAEDRRAAAPNDLAVLRSGARSEDAETRRVAIRALGRLERPSLIPDLVPALRHALPEIRAEAANAIGQAAQGWKNDRSAADARALTAAAEALAARLRIEGEPEVRAALTETIGRLPYATSVDVSQAERTLVDAGSTASSISDRLGVAKGFEALSRTAQKIQPLGDEAIAALKRLSTPSGTEA